jgi:hypothetical protein
VLVARLRHEAGLDLRFVGPCPGGEVGAALIADPWDRMFIISSIAGDPASRARHARSLAVLDRLWTIGHPAPRYEQIVDLDDVLVILQTVAPGKTPIHVTEILVDRMLDLLDQRRELMVNDEQAGPLPLYLLREGPGFAQHQSLRTESDRTRRLLDWIHDVGHRFGDVLEGADAVHFDYHPSNILVDSRRPDEISAVVDWDGAARGDAGFDLVTLYFVNGLDLERADVADQRLWRYVSALPEAVLLPS